MKETPIIMSGNHPNLILNGDKTQTRRVMKPQPQLSISDEMYKANMAKFNFKCPYGQVGDRLIIKETWATEKRYDHLKPSEIPDTAKIYYIDKAIHKAGGYSLFTEMGKVRSAMFMCLWMSRARPEITEVRVERVQKISSKDALKEGIPLIECFEEYPTSRFRKLWDSLNAKRGYGWDATPWVWVISFKWIAG